MRLLLRFDLCSAECLQNCHYHLSDSPLALQRPCSERSFCEIYSLCTSCPPTPADVAEPCHSLLALTTNAAIATFELGADVISTFLPLMPPAIHQLIQQSAPATAHNVQSAATTESNVVIWQARSGSNQRNIRFSCRQFRRVSNCLLIDWLDALWHGLALRGSMGCAVLKSTSCLRWPTNDDSDNDCRCADRGLCIGKRSVWLLALRQWSAAVAAAAAVLQCRTRSGY